MANHCKALILGQVNDPILTGERPREAHLRSGIATPGFHMSSTIGGFPVRLSWLQLFSTITIPLSVNV